ncbi:hypothetical protein DY000_02009426 [Brassica cretica]|uniref:Uncharacterized protein n=1 Tax=Brassica cretica TaxID=69181 RepID=A0ABQ7C8T8_BRACR|nr:hypothetical protein DY000_02009426 [Brassica cretica]
MTPKGCVTAKSRREAAVGQVETVCVVDLCGGLCRFGGVWVESGAGEAIKSDGSEALIVVWFGNGISVCGGRISFLVAQFKLARLRLCGVLVGILSRIKRTYMSASHPYPKVVLIEWRSLLLGYEGSGSWTLLFGGRKQPR